VADCVFCKIASGEMKVNLVYEDKLVAAFRDINPQAPVHILVVPKQHFETLNDLRSDETLMAALLKACIVVARQEGIDKDGYRVVANCGAKAGQSVFHVHVHLLGGRPMRWPPG
jgi:histidine triad (HIT) family protein